MLITLLDIVRVNMMVIMMMELMMNVKNVIKNVLIVLAQVIALVLSVQQQILKVEEHSMLQKQLKVEN